MCETDYCFAFGKKEERNIMASATLISFIEISRHLVCESRYMHLLLRRIFKRSNMFKQDGVFYPGYNKAMIQVLYLVGRAESEKLSRHFYDSRLC
jgi:hypothetical protein